MKFIWIASMYALLIALTTSAIAADPNEMLIRNPFVVYTDGKVVVNHPYPGFKQKSLIINNDYNKIPGCYMACYSHDKKQGLYAVSNNVYMMGLVRVPGTYHKRVCIADKNKTGSSADYFKKLCNEKLVACKNGCWAGGDTGGWYGIQAMR